MSLVAERYEGLADRLESIRDGELKHAVIQVYIQALLLQKVARISVSVLHICACCFLSLFNIALL